MEASYRQEKLNLSLFLKYMDQNREGYLVPVCHFYFSLYHLKNALLEKKCILLTFTEETTWCCIETFKALFFFASGLFEWLHSNGTQWAYLVTAQVGEVFRFGDDSKRGRRREADTTWTFRQLSTDQEQNNSASWRRSASPGLKE